MSDLIVTNIDGQLLVDSRLIAERLGIQHRVLFRTINKYLTELQGFGQLRFQNATVTNSVGAVNLLHNKRHIHLVKVGKHVRSNCNQRFSSKFH